MKTKPFYWNIFEIIVEVISPASSYKAKQKEFKDREKHYYMYSKFFKRKCVDGVWFFINIFFVCEILGINAVTNDLKTIWGILYLSKLCIL